MLVLITLADVGRAATGDISTVAGGPGQGLATGLSQFPISVATSGGYVYVADPAWNVIRRLDPVTHTETVVAGSGVTESSSIGQGEGGPATSAGFNFVQAVALNAAGDLFIVDGNNGLLFRVDAASGLIERYAGGGTSTANGDLATAAQIGSPLDVTVGPDGTVYLTSHNGAPALRRIDPATRRIYTISGLVLAPGGTFSLPLGVSCCDTAGNLYVADAGVHAVYAGVTNQGQPNQLFTPWAGTGTAGFGPDNTTATSSRLNAPSDVEYATGLIADTNNNRIRRVAGGIISTFAGTGVAGFSGDNGPPGLAKLSGPESMATDASGATFIADSGNWRVREVSQNVITTVAGKGLSTLGGDGGPATSAQIRRPQGVAFDAAGNMYIVDSDNERIREVDTGGTISTVAGGGAAMNGTALSVALTDPRGIAVDGAGNVYFADTFAHRIAKLSGGVVSTVAGTGTQGYSGDNGPATAAQLLEPRSVALDGAGNIYIADTGNACVRKVTGTTITRFAGQCDAALGDGGDGGPALAATFEQPYGLAVDGAGNVYVSDASAGRIRRISGGTITAFAGPSGGFGGFNGDGAALTTLFNNPTGLAVDPAGAVYVADSGNDRVRRVAGGTVTTIAGDGTHVFRGEGGPATQAALFDPRAVALDATGNVYIADDLSHRIRRVQGPCGNGQPDAGEQCDAGAANGTPSSCCDASCHLRPGTYVCNPGSGDQCDPDERCTGTGPDCPADQYAASTVVCRSGSGDACDPDEHCPGMPDLPCPPDVVQPSTSVCRSSTHPICDPEERCSGTPGQPCPVDVRLTNVPCEDGNVCNGHESCQNGSCVSGGALDCGDQNACTIDRCDPVTGCAHTPIQNCNGGGEGLIGGPDKLCMGGTPVPPPPASPTQCVLDAGSTQLTVPLDPPALPQATNITVADISNTVSSCTSFAVGQDYNTRLATCTQIEPHGLQLGPGVTLRLDWVQAATCRISANGTLNKRDSTVSIESTVVTPKCSAADNCPTMSAASYSCVTGACGTATCDPINNFWELHDLAHFSGFAVAVPCDGFVQNPKLKVGKLTDGGEQSLKVAGIVERVPSDPPLDPVQNGFRFALYNAAGSVLDAVVPGGAYDAATRSGWVAAGGNRWTYRHRSPGITRVTVTDKGDIEPGRVAFEARGSRMALASLATLPLHAAVQVFLPEDGIVCHRRLFDQTPPSQPGCAVLRGRTLSCR